MLKHDIHLSAFEISQNSIKQFEKLGFQRDEFANNTRCGITVYHGTYRGSEKLPNNDLWNKFYQILNNDKNFIGSLEEEEYDADAIIYFNGTGSGVDTLLPKMDTEQPADNIYKACDIHISINLEKSNNDCLRYLEALQVASFDKPKNDGIHRIFTVTCETTDDGIKAFSIIGDYLRTHNGIMGKMKLEKITRYIRKPLTAQVLPLTSKQAFQAWLKQLR